MNYLESWEINPNKKPDLNFDDWHIGYSDSSDRKYPQYPHNKAYMMGWLNCLGMDAGYTNKLPIINEQSYLDGYEDAQGERICHYPDQPDIRELQTEVKPKIEEDDDEF